MNFIALIGIIDELKKEQKYTDVKIRVEKPYVTNINDSHYEFINVSLADDIFEKEINALTAGTVVGIKGRLKMKNNNCQIIGERIQVF